MSSVTSNTSSEQTARAIVLCCLVFLSLAVSADTLTGKVVKITNGDTRYVLDANYQQHKTRLAGIDAPERKQAYGLASRKHLASIVAGKQVTVAGQAPFSKNRGTPTLKNLSTLEDLQRLVVEHL